MKIPFFAFAKLNGNPLFIINGGTVKITGGSFKRNIVKELNYGENSKQSVKVLLTKDYQLSESDSNGWYQVIQS